MTIKKIYIGGWFQRTTLIWPESKQLDNNQNQASFTSPATLTLQLCASNGEYDFSNLDIKKVGKVEFTARPDCWIKVSLPLTSCVTHDPVVEVQRVWSDGSKDIDGPNRIVPSRTGKLFFVKALQGEGVYKIIAK